MGKRRRSKSYSRASSSATRKPTIRIGDDIPQLDRYGAQADAIKTYLQQQVSIIRPQVADVEMAHLARFAVTARSAVGLRAESLRQVDFMLGDNNRMPFTPTNDLEKALNLAFNNNFQSLIERCEWSYCFYGEVLMRRLYFPTRFLSGFQWINNNFWRLDTDHWDGLKGFHIRAAWASDLDPDVSYLPLDDAVYFHDMDFFEDFGGVGPVQVAYVQAATETEISATQLQFFRNMAMPGFIMQPAQNEGFRPGKEQKDEIAEYLRRMYQGAANAGRAMVMPTRWEMVKLQQDFDKLGMPALTQEARDAVIRILRVPLELLEPRQSTRSSGTKFYDQKREWLISWLVPQAERYADVFTEQIAKRYNPNWRIIPNFDRVRGLEEDIGSRTETTSKQVADSLLDLYSAQEILGIDPDDNLKGVYIVSGVPVPSEAIRTYYQMAPGGPGIGRALGGEHGKEGTPETSSHKPTKPTQTTAEQLDFDTDRKKSYLPDIAYKELKNWRLMTERRGVDYPFEAKALAPDTVAFGRMLLSATSVTSEVWDAIRVYATKDYSDTERLYRADLWNAMLDAFSGRLDRKQFGVSGRDTISMAFMSAFKNGLQEGGVDPSEITAEEQAALADEIKQERVYWTKLSNEMFAEVLPLKGTPEFDAARSKMLDRIDLWVNAGLRHVYGMGKVYAGLNSMKKWVMDGGEHCLSCAAANGQIHRARSWKNRLLPQSEQCICTGINCKCTLIDTDEKASGSLSSIPLAGA